MTAVGPEGPSHKYCGIRPWWYVTTAFDWRRSGSALEQETEPEDRPVARLDDYRDL